MDVTSYLLGKNSGGGSTTTLQDKEVTITTNTTTTIEADTGYDGLNSVEVTTNVGGGSKYNVLADMTNYINASFISYIKEINDIDFSNFSSMDYCFSSFSGLETIGPNCADTRNVTSMVAMFYNCTLLKNIPQFDTSRVTTMYRMFANIGAQLTDESLNNILGMCINATSYTAEKTLNYMRLNEGIAPKARIEALPNYQAFINAGWTIGY